MVIPAHPLALTADRRLDERHQRALSRYYLDAGAGGLAVGVHTTQFAIRDPKHGLLGPVLELASEVAATAPERPVLIAGICGDTRQAVREAELAASLGYDAALVSMVALGSTSEDALVEHCRVVADVLPIFGFYLQEAVGGRYLSVAFWRRLAELERLVAIKVAPFNRYRTLDVFRAVAESGRADEIALYTGNDDHIIGDLLMLAAFCGREMAFHGGLLGQWAMGTRAAVEVLRTSVSMRRSGYASDVLGKLGSRLTDLNGAVFDAANSFRGCIPGINEVLRRLGLMHGNWCLDPAETLSPGQKEEIDRVLALNADLLDYEFIRERLGVWLD